MSTAIQTQGKLTEAIEACLIHGDLSKLDPAGRLSYYKATCESLGLNPLTRPLEYITLNGKLTLYARRECAEQLRKIHGIAITSMKPEQVGDLLVVTVTAQDRNGRTDASTGAVSTKGLSGENLANAMMKAETKAKRRVTLSLSGLGLLDETEVASIPDAKAYSEPQVALSATPRPVPTLSEELEAENHVFQLLGQSQVRTTVLDAVQKKSKKGTDYWLVTMAGEVEGRGSAFCYAGHLSEAIRQSKGEVAQFEYELKGDWLTITDVLGIGEIEYRDGKPYIPAEDESKLTKQLKASLEITDADLPETLFSK